MDAFHHITAQLFNQSASSRSRHNKNHVLPKSQHNAEKHYLLHLSVSHSVHMGGVPWQVPPWAGTPPRQVPPMVGTPPLPPGQVHPPGRCTPPGQVHPRAGPPRQVYPHPCPPRQVHPPQQCMLGYGQQAGGTHPTGMHSCFYCCVYWR